MLIIGTQTFYQNRLTAHLTTLEIQHNQRIFQQLNGMQQQWSKMMAATPTQTFNQSLLQLSNTLREIKQLIMNQQNEMKKITQQLNQQPPLAPPASTRSTALNKIYLEISALPFQVMAMDVIADQPFVTVEYQHHLMPLLRGDEVAGWRLTTMDYQTAHAEFKNAHGEYVRVAVQGE